MIRRPVKIRAVCLLLICYLTQATAFAYGECQSNKASDSHPNQLTADTTAPAMSEHDMSQQEHCDDMAMSSDATQQAAPPDDQEGHIQNCCDLTSTGCAMSHCFSSYSIATASTSIQIGEPSFVWHETDSGATPTCPANNPFRPPIFS
jgi:hypothetical protein